MKHKIKIKPLSINQCWQGRRYKTPAYIYYEKAVMSSLPKGRVPKGPLEIKLEFGFSSKLSDWDNGIKVFCDILQKKYNFDDNRIYKGTIIKKIVKKGQEYVLFEIRKLKKRDDNE